MTRQSITLESGSDWMNIARDEKTITIEIAQCSRKHTRRARISFNDEAAETWDKIFDLINRDLVDHY